LLVDDTTTMREVMKVYFMGKDITVTEAVDGRNAVELMERAAFDVVVTDLVMPNVDGLELARHIRKNKSQAVRNVPILLYSALTHPTLEKTRWRRVSAFLRKPFGADALLRAVNALLDTAARRCACTFGWQPCCPVS